MTDDWNAEAREAAQAIQEGRLTASRVLPYSVEEWKGHFVLFGRYPVCGERGDVCPDTGRSLEAIQDAIRSDASLEQLGFGTSEDGCVWAILVKHTSDVDSTSKKRLKILLAASQATCDAEGTCCARTYNLPRELVEVLETCAREFGVQPERLVAAILHNRMGHMTGADARGQDILEAYKTWLNAPQAVSSQPEPRSGLERLKEDAHEHLSECESPHTLLSKLNLLRTRVEKFALDGEAWAEEMLDEIDGLRARLVGLMPPAGCNKNHRGEGESE